MQVANINPRVKQVLRVILPLPVRNALRKIVANGTPAKPATTVEPKAKPAAEATYRYPFNDLPFFGKNKALNVHLSKAAIRLERKLAGVAPNLKEIGMSQYSQRYMFVVFGTRFRRNYNLTKYGHILSKALEPYSVADLQNLTLVDYGGGHGTLSLLAKEVGVGNVIHSDIFATSSKDAALLARTIEANPGPFFLGDTPEFRRQMGSIKADVIVNYDVLEHVYNFRQYFIDLAAVTAPGGRWYMGSGANLYNDQGREDLIQKHDEIEGIFGSDNEAAYINVRAKYISETEPSLLPQEIEALAAATRGWRRKDIERAAAIYTSSGHIVEFCPPLNNTSDPLNGNWAENMVPVETYTEHPFLKSVAKHISVEASALWNPFIETNVTEAAKWKAVAKGDTMAALKKAPYYCVNVQF